MITLQTTNKDNVVIVRGFGKRAIIVEIQGKLIYNNSNTNLRSPFRCLAVYLAYIAFTRNWKYIFSITAATETIEENYIFFTNRSNLKYQLATLNIVTVCNRFDTVMRNTDIGYWASKK